MKTRKIKFLLLLLAVIFLSACSEEGTDYRTTYAKQKEKEFFAEEAQKEIREIFVRQKKAMETKDVELYLSDIHPWVRKKERRIITERFSHPDRFSVNFEIKEIAVKPVQAKALVKQRTKVLGKGPKYFKDTELEIVMWFSRTGGKWYMTGTEIRKTSYYE